MDSITTRFGGDTRPLEQAFERAKRGARSTGKEIRDGVGREGSRGMSEAERAAERLRRKVGQVGDQARRTGRDLDEGLGAGVSGRIDKTAGAIGKLSGVLGIVSAGLAGLGIGRVFDAAFAAANETAKAAADAGTEVDGLTSATLRSEQAFKQFGKTLSGIAVQVIGGLNLMGEAIGNAVSGGANLDTLLTRNSRIGDIRAALSSGDMEQAQALAGEERNNLLAARRSASAAGNTEMVDAIDRQLRTIARAFREYAREAEAASDRFVNAGASFFEDLANEVDANVAAFARGLEEIDTRAAEKVEDTLARLQAERAALIAAGQSGQVDPVKTLREVERLTSQIAALERQIAAAKASQASSVQAGATPAAETLDDSAARAGRRVTPRRNAGGEITNFDELRPQEQERFAATRFSPDREASARIAREREIGPTAAQAERFATLGSDFRSRGDKLSADFRARFRGSEAAPFDPSALERAAGSMAAQAGGDPVAANTAELVRLFREIVQERPQ